MAKIIHVDFRKNVYTLKQARKFLGSGYFRKALFEWSLDELRSTANDPEAMLSDAWLAYGVILKWRERGESINNNPIAEVIPLFRKQAA